MASFPCRCLSEEPTLWNHRWLRPQLIQLAYEKAAAAEGAVKPAIKGITTFEVEDAVEPDKDRVAAEEKGAVRTAAEVTAVGLANTVRSILIKKEIANVARLSIL